MLASQRPPRLQKRHTVWQASLPWLPDAAGHGRATSSRGGQVSAFSCQPGPADEMWASASACCGHEQVGFSPRKSTPTMGVRRCRSVHQAAQTCGMLWLQVSHRVHGTHSRAEVLSCRSDPLAKSCWEPALPPTEG